MNIYGPFHTNWDCFYSPKTEQVGCPRAAHSSFIGSSWWNRIPYLFPVSYSPKQNLMHKFQHNSPNQFLDFTDCPKCLKNFSQFGPMFWDRSNGPSRPQTNRNMILSQNFTNSTTPSVVAVTAAPMGVQKFISIRSQGLGHIKRPLTASLDSNIRKVLKEGIKPK